MDEIEWMKSIKKVLKILNIVLLCVFIPAILYGFVQYILGGDIEYLIYMLEQSAIIMLSTGVFSIIVYICLYVIYKSTYVKINITIGKEYIRELHNYYPPAIVSLIYDLKTEVYKDYTATILQLYLKKYINISGFNEDIVIEKGKNENLSKLLKHELYVYNCLIYKRMLDEIVFKNFILEDAEEKGLLIFQKNKNNVKIYIKGFIISILFIVMLVLSKNPILQLILSLVVSVIITAYYLLPYMLKKMEIDIISKDCKLTSKGKKELRKIKGFKNFIKDFTLIEEKDIEYIQILEEYIPYSLSLGMSPQVEQYIKENEIYRNLIYKGKEQ